MPRPSKPSVKSILSEPECKALWEFLRVSDGAKGSAEGVQERLLTSLTFAYRRLLTSN